MRESGKIHRVPLLEEAPNVLKKAKNLIEKLINGQTQSRGFAHLKDNTDFPS
jgi:hypothetical protein